MPFALGSDVVVSRCADTTCPELRRGIDPNLAGLFQWPSEEAATHRGDHQSSSILGSRSAGRG